MIAATLKIALSTEEGDEEKTENNYCLIVCAGKAGRSGLRPYRNYFGRFGEKRVRRLISSRWLRGLVSRKPWEFRLRRRGGGVARCRRGGGASRSRLRRRILRRRCGRWI